MAANGDLLRRLFRSYTKRDDTGFRAAAQTLIEEERAKNHRLLADDLEHILRSASTPINTNRSLVALNDIPKDREKGFPLFDVTTYDYDWDRLITSADTLNLLQQVAVEHQRRDVLAASGLGPKSRILFYGPPGCGKSLAAKVMSGVLRYPLVTVRFDAVVSSLLGETSANLRKVFDFIQRGTWVVLFDEFDAIGKDRNNDLEHGELKRVVNSLLQMMDAFYGESLLIAATNHESLLDNAVWRRFEAVAHFAPPTPQDRVLLFRLFLRGFNTKEVDFSKVARRMNGATGADLEFVAVEAARRAVLDQRGALNTSDFSAALKLLAQRNRAVQSLSEIVT